MRNYWTPKFLTDEEWDLIPFRLGSRRDVEGKAQQTLHRLNCRFLYVGAYGHKPTLEHLQAENIRFGFFRDICQAYEDRNAYHHTRIVGCKVCGSNPAEVTALVLRLLKIAEDRNLVADAEDRLQSAREAAVDDAQRVANAINHIARRKAAQALLDAHAEEFEALVAEEILCAKVDEYRRVFRDSNYRTPLHVGWAPSVTKEA